MTKRVIRMFSFAMALALLHGSAAAQNGEAIFKSKCAMCHGVDGGKIAGHELGSADVQKQSDGEIAGIISNGRPPKMPAFKALKPEELSRVVDYIRTLKK